MPTIQDIGFVISIKKYNDRSKIIKIFSKSNGIISGFLKNKHTRTEKYKDQVGNYVYFSCEIKNIDGCSNIETQSIEDFLNIFFINKLYLLLFNSMISILNNILIKNDVVDEIYKIFYNLMFCFKENNKNTLLNYVDFLYNIVEYTGISINVDKCDLDNNDVFYISPKTGNGISKELGEKYKNQLFSVPQCFLYFNNEYEEIIKAINVLHYFIYKFCKENNIIKKYESIKFFKTEIIKYLKK